MGWWSCRAVLQGESGGDRACLLQSAVHDDDKWMWRLLLAKARAKPHAGKLMGRTAEEDDVGEGEGEDEDETLRSMAMLRRAWLESG